jgi:hypothetical protein
VAQLNRVDPRDAGAIRLAVGAAGNVLGALGNRVYVTVHSPWVPNTSSRIGTSG